METINFTVKITPLFSAVKSFNLTVPFYWKRTGKGYRSLEPTKDVLALLNQFDSWEKVY